jgi:transposase
MARIKKNKTKIPERWLIAVDYLTQYRTVKEIRTQIGSDCNYVYDLMGKLQSCGIEIKMQKAKGGFKKYVILSSRETVEKCLELDKEKAIEKLSEKMFQISELKELDRKYNQGMPWYLISDEGKAIFKSTVLPDRQIKIV